MSSSPLIDSLFRPTTLTPTTASAAPVRAAGTRSRAGNAMNRTRQALLAGAAAAVQTNGTRITMAQVAATAGVAKATLYNHFRTREAVLDALLVDQVARLVEAQAGKDLSHALVDTATQLSRHPLCRALATLEPATLAAIGRIDDTAAGWRAARTALDAALRAESRAGSDTVLRWLASFVLSPADPATIALDVAVLLAGLPILGIAEPTRTQPDVAGPAARPRPWSGDGSDAATRPA